MYSNTRFGEVMKGLPRGQFERLISDLEADKHCKGFRSWDQLLAMLYAQLCGSRSLREVEAGFNAQRSHHYHLGSREVRRSTLADANRKRSSAVFAAVCNRLLGQAKRKTRREVKDLLYLLDSTPIPLKGLGYDEWASANTNHRTQGLKVHLMFTPSGDVPVYQRITPPNVNDVEIGRHMPVQAGATYVFDKGYCDYNWWYRLDQVGAFFVTRWKHNAALQLLETRTLDEGEEALILEDAVVAFRHRRPRGGRVNAYQGTPLRRIVVARPDQATPLVLATNDFERRADEIAALYKQRWAIELFFKWLKQNLKIKQFLGRSENAVKIQLYTALIAYLLVQHYRERHGIQQSLKLLLAALRSGLFQRPETERRTGERRRRRRLESQLTQWALPL